MLSSAVSLPSPARTEFQPQPRRAPVQEKNRSLFDLLLDETDLAVQILARLILQAALGHEEKGESHE
jgi:hypothetical protein